jgi:hypothetical protein
MLLIDKRIAGIKKVFLKKTETVTGSRSSMQQVLNFKEIVRLFQTLKSHLQSKTTIIILFLTKFIFWAKWHP